MNWFQFYCGGVVCGFLFTATIVVWQKQKNSYTAFGYMASVFWPIVLPISIIMAFTPMKAGAEYAAKTIADREQEEIDDERF